MPKLLQWIAHGLSRLAPKQRLSDTDRQPEFEQVDGRHLHASDFRSSAAMRLDQSPAAGSIDFSDTLPACSFRRDEFLSRNSRLITLPSP